MSLKLQEKWTLNKFSKIGDTVIFKASSTDLEGDQKIEGCFTGMLVCSCAKYCKYAMCKHSLAYSNINDQNQIRELVWYRIQ